ncbi:unnamed protein product [Penicillium roqueforti FM164]|uniref:Genomic scaffold, ProqFM164S03 n=1 Tax=Penicillium roqueforti (strain FM164) TaxID=1365484 RepID=W6QE83_PENRF|nr:unnamed protein product [Penicillium roqueforti FM164]
MRSETVKPSTLKLRKDIGLVVFHLSTAGTGTAALSGFFIDRSDMVINFSID